MMRTVIIRALAALALAIPITAAVEVTPASASVAKPCTAYWYANPSRLFTTCSAGSTFYAQRAKINCNNGHSYYGVWQPLPGPWYGSTATCAGGSLTLGGAVEFLY